MRQRSTVEIFNLSFLDVFACVLGALLLILIMVAISISTQLTSQAVAERLDKAKESSIEDNERIAVLEKVVEDGQRWRSESETLSKILDENETEATSLEREKTNAEERIRSLERSLAESPSEDSLQEELEKAKQLQENLSKRVQISRDKTKSSIQFKAVNPAAAVPQEPRCFSVTAQGAMDLKTGEVLAPFSSQWERILTDLRRNRAQEYALFIIKPTGVEIFEKLRKDLDSNGLQYGFEPYTSFWDPVYIANGRDSMLD